MAHDKVYGICENKCMVELDQPIKSESVGRVIYRSIKVGTSKTLLINIPVDNPGYGVNPFITIDIKFTDLGTETPINKFVRCKIVGIDTTNDSDIRESFALEKINLIKRYSEQSGYTVFFVGNSDIDFTDSEYISNGRITLMVEVEVIN